MMKEQDMLIADIRKVDDPYEEFVGNGEACRFCFARKGRDHHESCIWQSVRYIDAFRNQASLSPPEAQGSREDGVQEALRNLVSAAMVVVGNALDFHDRRQTWLCTVCRYRDPLGDKGTKLHADECPIYKLHAACDVAGPLIESATWANAGATPPGKGATESAQESSSFPSHLESQGTAGRRMCSCGSLLVCPDIGCDENKPTASATGSAPKPALRAEAARRVQVYMAQMMGMRDVLEDQEQNWIYSHMTEFALSLHPSTPAPAPRETTTKAHEQT